MMGLGLGLGFGFGLGLRLGWGSGLSRRAARGARLGARVVDVEVLAHGHGEQREDDVVHRRVLEVSLDPLDQLERHLITVRVRSIIDARAALKG